MELKNQLSLLSLDAVGRPLGTGRPSTQHSLEGTFVQALAQSVGALESPAPDAGALAEDAAPTAHAEPARPTPSEREPAPEREALERVEPERDRGPAEPVEQARKTAEVRGTEPESRPESSEASGSSPSPSAHVQEEASGRPDGGQAPGPDASAEPSSARPEPFQDENLPQDAGAAPVTAPSEAPAPLAGPLASPEATPEAFSHQDHARPVEAVFHSSDAPVAAQEGLATAPMPDVASEVASEPWPAAPAAHPATAAPVAPESLAGPDAQLVSDSPVAPEAQIAPETVAIDASAAPESSASLGTEPAAAADVPVESAGPTMRDAGIPSQAAAPAPEVARTGEATGAVTDRSLPQAPPQVAASSGPRVPAAEPTVQPPSLAEQAIPAPVPEASGMGWANQAPPATPAVAAAVAQFSQESSALRPESAPAAPVGAVSLAPVSRPEAATFRAPTLSHVQVADAVLDQVRLKLSPKMRSATVELEPAHLGKLFIEMRVDDGEITAVMRAERAETLSVLQSHEPELRAMLERTGLDAGSFEFSLAEHDTDGAQDGSAGAQASGSAEDNQNNELEELLEVRGAHSGTITADAVDFYA